MTFFKYRGQTFNGAIYLNTCRIDSTKNGASLALALFKGQKSTMYAFILRVFLNASAWQHESIPWKWIASAAFGKVYL